MKKIIKKLLWVPFIIFCVLVMLGYMDQIQASELSQTIQKLAVQKDEPFWIAYFFPGLAILASPLAGIVITSRVKKIYRFVNGRAKTKKQFIWRWCLYNFVHFFSTGLIASALWWAKYQDVYQTAIMGFLVAVLQTILTAITFWLISLFNKDLAHELQNGVNEADADATQLTKFKAVMLGTDERRRDRPDGQVWTEEQRQAFLNQQDEDITQPR